MLALPSESSPPPHASRPCIAFTLATNSFAMKSFSSLIKTTSSNSLFVVIYNLFPLAEPASHPGGEQKECVKVANSRVWCWREAFVFRGCLLSGRQLIKAPQSLVNLPLSV